jgi:hypothetical protein
MLGYAIYTFRLQSYEKASKKPKENEFFFVFSNESNFSKGESYEKASKMQNKLIFIFIFERKIATPHSDLQVRESSRVAKNYEVSAT